MKQIPVRLGKRSYDIVITDSCARLPRRLRDLGLSRHGWVISHERLLRGHGRELLSRLRQAGWTISTTTVPESESSKSFAVVQRIIGRLARQATMRVPVVFALGGGVIGDLSGFVAAVFRRGVPFVQVPTTLLAQVDSAIGGKVGIDIPQAKNFVGAIYQPRLVWNNIEYLRTLPMRQRRSGLSEVIKYGVIADPGLFRYLERHLDACLSLRGPAVRLMVERSCRIKARIVSQDERETKRIRHQLNFGHTLGHALEAASSYRRWTHGEAIAIGMCAAAELAVELGHLRVGEYERLAGLIRAAGLPTRATRISRRAVLTAMRYDKKFVRGRSRWVLPKAIGRVVVTESVPERLVRDVVARYVR